MLARRGRQAGFGIETSGHPERLASGGDRRDYYNVVNSLFGLSFIWRFVCYRQQSRTRLSASVLELSMLSNLANLPHYSLLSWLLHVEACLEGNNILDAAGEPNYQISDVDCDSFHLLSL